MIILYNSNMNKLRILLSIVLCYVLTPTSVSAQDNGLNPVYKVQLTDITYQKDETKKKVTVGKVLGVVADVVEGRVTDVNNEEYIPLARNRVMEGLTHVRRLQVVEGDEVTDAKYQVSAILTDIAATRKVKTYDRKDSNGREYTETKTYYGIRTALYELADNIYEYYNECYPIRANIIERGVEKRDKTKEVYIDVGSRFIGEDIHFNVYVVGQVAGRETRKQIGRIRVRETMGDDVSLCKVQKGGKEIKVLGSGPKVKSGAQWLLGSGPKVKSQATVLWRQTQGLRIPLWRQSHAPSDKKNLANCFVVRGIIPTFAALT